MKRQASHYYLQLMLEMLYQLVKCGLYGKLNVVQHPAFVRLRKDSETPAKFRSLAAPELLQRWTTHHLSTKPPTFSISMDALSAEDFRILYSAISTTPEPLADDSDWLVSLAQQTGVKLPPLLDSNTIGNAPLQALFLAQLAHAAPGTLFKSLLSFSFSYFQIQG